MSRTFEKCNNGHYAFCTTMPEPVVYGKFTNLYVIKGRIFEQIVVEFEDLFGRATGGCVKFEIDKNGVISTDLLLPKLDSFLLSFGIDMVAVWQKNDIVESNHTAFFTDSNGLELVERKVIPKENKLVPQLTFPVQTMIGIHNRVNKSMTVIVDHVHGGTAKPSRG